MRAFEDIPNEILLQIASDVHSSDQLSLSLTSRRLHSIAESHLYRSVTLKDRVVETERERKLQTFLRTIISRPELGAITRHLEIMWNDSFDERGEIGCKQYSYDGDRARGYLATLQTLARKKGLSALAVSELENGWCRPHLSLLMHLLPSLKSLLLVWIRWNAKMDTRWVWAEDEYHGPTPVGLRTLSDLEIHQGTAYDLIPLMSLPTLNSFRASFLYGAGGKQEILRSMRSVKRSSKLRKLQLKFCAVDTELLDGILQLPEALDTLILMYHYSFPRHIDPSAVARTFHHQIHSLTTLSVTDVIPPDMIEDLEPMGSLRDFTLLKTLRIPCLYLLGNPITFDDGPQD